MNKHLHRIIFNKARGLLMVVAENSSSSGQSGSSGDRPGTVRQSATLRPICFALLLACGMVSSPEAAANIVADGAQNQRPTVLASPNGVPLVNINTPSAAGVSRNVYSQFDVTQQGAILNNAQGNSQTRLGGWVQGNANLAGGSARVILNEVNSTNPSLLHGYVEVAGSRAQVVIANPSGISCDGCGFINANRVTLSTGQAVLNNGNLEGYRVQQGRISIDGAGMDGRNADYTDLIARSVQINAGLWANTLQLHTGSGQISADLQQRSAASGSGAAPAYAIDVASLGGMYAGKILLTGNEHGVGMRQAGHIGASAGAVQISHDGRLENSGSISAATELRINSSALDNSGTLQSAGNSSVHSSGELNNSGSLLAGAALDVSAAAINNHATIAAADALTLRAAHISNQSALISAGGQLTMQADAIDNRHGDSTQGLHGRDIAINAAAIDNRHGHIVAARGLSVNSSGRMDNGNGLISAGDQLQLQDSGTSLAIANQHGTLQAGRQLTLASHGLSGDGTLQSGGDLAVTLGSDFHNSGRIQAAGNASLNSSAAIHNQGTLQAGATLAIHAAALDNGAVGNISATRTELDMAQQLDNRGLIDGRDTVLRSATLNNTGSGRIYGDRIAIAATTLNNDTEQGRAAVIAARQQLDLGVGTLNNNEHALLYSDGDLAIGGRLDDKLRASGRADSINNRSATIEAMAGLSLASRSINNSNLHFATALQSDGDGERITEYQGAGAATRYRPGSAGVYVYNEESDHLMTPEGVFPSWSRYDYQRRSQTTVITASDPGTLRAGGDIRIDADSLINDKSHIIAGGNLNADVAELHNVDAIGQHIVNDSGSVTSFWRKQRKGRDETGSSIAAYTPPAVITDISLGSVSFRQHAGPGGQRQTIAAHHGSSVELQAGDNRMVLPDSSLFHYQPQPQHGYLVETDPRFTGYKQWLSSDYMLQALALDPAQQQKRLGDGFYEQRLVREQVAQLTGRRLLDGYHDDEAQYRALLDQGVAMAQTWQLRPGIALSAAQVASLNRDLVWLVEKDIVLPDGSSRKALVPQLYTRVRNTDLAHGGSLLAARDMALNVSGTLDNQGSIAATGQLAASASQIDNNGGRISAGQMRLNADTDLNNAGGSLTANTLLHAVAGRDLNLVSDTRSNSNAQGSVTALNRVAGVQVRNGGDSSLQLGAGRDLNLVAADISNQGSSTVLAAGNNLNLTTVGSSTQQTVRWDDANVRHDSSSTDNGSRIHSRGDITVLAGQDVDARAANLNSSDGTLRIAAGNDIRLQSGNTQHSVDEAHRHRGSSGWLSRTTTSTRDRLELQQSQGTLLSAERIQLQAGHDISASGSQVVSTRHTALQAGRQITLDAADNRRGEQHLRQETTSGLLGGSGGIGFSIGRREQSTDQLRQRDTSHASIVASTDGDINISAGQRYRQRGSEVLAPKGNIDINARQIDISAARERGSDSTETRFRQSGLSVSLSNPVLGAISTAQHMTQAASHSSDPRMQALAAAGTVLAASNAYDAVAARPDQAGGINISISAGSSSQQSRITQQQELAAAATVAAAGDIRLHATEQLTVQGSTVQAGGDLSLQAQQIKLLAAAEQSRQHSSSKGGSASLGVSFGSNGLMLTASASGNRGRADGSDDTWRQTTLQAGQTLRLNSSGDTTLQGARASGQQVVAAVGGNLDISSVQQHSRFDSKQQSIGGSLSVGAGLIGGSVDLSKSRINSEYRSVAGQSGIQAGDRGFQVAVNGNTVLDGAVIASSEQAVQDGSNRFHGDGTLTLRNMHNQTDYQADGTAVSLQISGDDMALPSGGGSGQAKGHASGSSLAGISGIAGNQAVRSGDSDGGIAPVFNAEQVQRDINAQVQITQAFSQQAGQAVSHYVEQNRDRLLAQRAKAGSDEERNAIQAQLDELTMQQRVMNILIGGVTGHGGSAVSKEALSAAAAEMRSLMVADSAKFPGVTDGNVSYSNLSGPSSGVHKDGYKVGGTRWDLDALCGNDNSRCQTSSDGKLALDGQGRVQFKGSLTEFLASEQGKPLSGLTGGIQGLPGTLAGKPYAPGSLNDKVIEAFSGTHDMIGGKLGGLYDEQGNARRGRSDSEKMFHEAWTVAAIPVSAPFAMAEVVPPQVWQAMTILLQGMK